MDTADEPEIVNEASAHQTFQALCNHIKSILEDIEAVTVRLNAQLGVLARFEGERLEQSK